MNAFFLIQWIVSDAIQPCVKCKFVKKDFFHPQFGKCALYPIPMEEPVDNFYLVTGNKSPPKKIDYHYCNTARTFDSMCGKDGKYYQKQF